MLKVTLTSVIQIMLGPRTRIGLAALLMVGAVAAQQPTASAGPRFEVVCIRTVATRMEKILDRFYQIGLTVCGAGSSPPRFPSKESI